MSNPQKQVGSKRLPPLLSSISLPSNLGKTDINKRTKSREKHRTTINHVIQQEAGIVNKISYLENAFLQGPFRKPLEQNGLIATVTSISPPLKHNKYDGQLLLKDLDYLDPEIIYEFLKRSPVLMENYIRDYVTREELEIWLENKVVEKFQESLSITSFNICGLPPSAKWKNTSTVERQYFMEKFIAEVYATYGDVRGGILNQLVDCCSSSISASGFNLYLADGDGKSIWQYVPDSNNPINLHSIKEGSTIPCYVAATKESIITTATENDERFPEGLGTQDSHAGCVLCLPIITSSGDLAGVAELTRVKSLHIFSEKDNQIANSILAWGGIVLHYAEMYHTMHKQRKLNEFLLNVTKSIFQDIVSMDTVIMKIMNFAQTLVDADRTSLFLMDHKTNELYARIFDIGTGLETKLQQEIRFPKTKGVAGHVATTGETLNIKDAYDDPRFNKDVDNQTGYRTQTLLCMPIYIRGNLIGVVQMVNKKQGVFTAADEKAFQTFAVYCGLALHHAKLYDKIRRSEQKYKVALEVLSYHSMCTETEVLAVQNCESIKHFDESQRIALQDPSSMFELNVFDLESIKMASMAVALFDDLFKTDSRFDLDEVTRFTLTVRKNYRRVPYHNWTHAFTVAHCMFCLVKHSKGVITGLEAVALYVACLCHDLDHRGKNNEWMKVESTPLAAVYTTSTLEHHHFNQTITILQHEGHNIFSQLNSSEYKHVLGVIKDCILSTDLATFFGNKAKLDAIISKDSFDWNNEDHRTMFRALAMTACDLSACAKPWKVQYETVKVIFQEFYAQGDEEKALGRTPVPMMDRDTADKLPNHQTGSCLITENPMFFLSKVGFLLGICIPGYDLLQKLIPGSKPLLDGAKKNLAVWSEMVKKQNEEKIRREAQNNEKDIFGSDEMSAILEEAETSSLNEETYPRSSSVEHTKSTSKNPRITNQ